ncbi:MAG: hypothetical protein V1645_04900 [archaeon]
MDRGQIFIGKKLEVKDYKTLNRELEKYGHRWDSKKRAVMRIDGQQTKYGLYCNNQTDPIEDGCIFGIEALKAYVNFEEYAAMYRHNLGKDPEKLPDGAERDWIQEISLEKLVEKIELVKKDIPDAKVLLMDLHY